MTIDSEFVVEVREVIHEYGPLTRLDIANALGCSYEAVCRATDRLEDDGQAHVQRHRWRLTGYGREQRGA